LNNTKDKSQRVLLRASCIVNSWLKSKGIETIVNDDNSILIKDSNYSIFLYNSEKEFIDNTIKLNIKNVLSRNNEISQKEVNFIFECLGLPEQSFVRSEIKKKATYKEDFEGLYLRHSQFNRSPNIPEEKIKEYLPAIKSVSGIFYTKFYKFLHESGFDKKDLISIGMVHLVGFVHEFETQNKDDNRKLFSNYLWQRFNNLVTAMQRKYKNALTQGLFISTEANENFEEYVFLAKESAIDSCDKVFEQNDSFDINIVINDKPTKLYVREDKFLNYRFFMNNKEYPKKAIQEMFKNKVIDFQ
jgi:hypothetical protein